jgi:hypothetical protein
MASQERKAAQATATGTLVSTACRVTGVYVRAAGTAGTLVLKDGGASGTARVTINTPAAVGGHYHEIGGDGITFATDCHATLTTADAVTIYYSQPL